MAISPGLVKSLLTTLGIGFVLTFTDEASDKLKSTQKNVDSLKTSLQGAGDQSDKLSKQLANMASMHDRVGTLAGKTLLLGTAVATLGYSITNAFSNAVRGALDLNTQIKQTQMEMGKLDQTTYNTLNRMAAKFSTMGVGPSDAGRIIVQLGGPFKTAQRVAAVAPYAATLSMISGGQLSPTQASNTLTQYMFSMHPGQASSPDARQNRSAALSSLGMMGAFWQNSQAQWFQIPELIRGLSGSSLNLQRRGVGDAEQQLLSLSALMLQRFPNNPDYSAYSTNWMSRLYDTNTRMSLMKLGIDTTPGGKPASFSSLVEQMRKSKLIRGALIDHTVAQGTPLYDKIINTLGGESMIGPLQVLLSKGGLDQYNRIHSSLMQAQKNPQGVIQGMIDFQKTDPQVQMRMFSAMKNFIMGDLMKDALVPLSVTLSQINKLLAKFVFFMQDHPQMARMIVDVGLLGVALVGLGTAVTFASKGLGLFEATMGMSLGRVLLLSGGIGALVVVIGGAAFLISKHLGGIKQAFADWYSGVEKPIHKFVLLFQSIGELFAHPHMIHTSLWRQDKKAGIGGIIEDIALLQWRLEHFGHVIGNDFDQVFGPLFKGLGMKKGGLAGFLDGILAGLDHVVKLLDKTDWDKIGKRVKTFFEDIASGIHLIGRGLSELKSIFDWMVQHPLAIVTASAMLRASGNNAAADAMSYVGAYSAISNPKSANNPLHHSLGARFFADALGGPGGDMIKAMAAGSDLAAADRDYQKHGFGNKLKATSELWWGLWTTVGPFGHGLISKYAPHLAKYFGAHPETTSAQMRNSVGNMVVSANNVYINGSIHGGGESGSESSGGFGHKLLGHLGQAAGIFGTWEGITTGMKWLGGLGHFFQHMPGLGKHFGSWKTIGEWGEKLEPNSVMSFLGKSFFKLFQHGEGAVETTAEATSKLGLLSKLGIPLKFLSKWLFGAESLPLLLTSGMGRGDIINDARARYGNTFAYYKAAQLGAHSQSDMNTYFGEMQIAAAHPNWSIKQVAEAYHKSISKLTDKLGDLNTNIHLLNLILQQSGGNNLPGLTGQLTLNSALHGPLKASKSVYSAIMSVSKQLGLDPRLAFAIAQNESGLNPGSIGDGGTSFGLYQLHRGGELGNLSPMQAFNPYTNAMTALSVVAQVARRHPNWTPGQIAAAAQRPADPTGYAKAVNAIYASMNGVQVAGARTTGVHLEIPTGKAVSILSHTGLHDNSPYIQEANEALAKHLAKWVDKAHEIAQAKLENASGGYTVIQFKVDSQKVAEVMHDPIHGVAQKKKRQSRGVAQGTVTRRPGAVS